MKSCGCLSRELISKRVRGKPKVDLTGSTFGRLTVLSVSHQGKNGQFYWNCKCSCGTQKAVCGARLKAGRSSSCGCINRERLIARNKSRRAEDPWVPVFKAYRKWKTKRGERTLEFSLTLDQFKELMSSHCCYCGQPPSMRIPSAALSNQLRNGIDRKSNEIGYNEGNCVPCCWACNSAKGSLSLEEFATSTKNRYKHMKSIGLF